MAADWSNEEVYYIVNDYFTMLLDELAGMPLNKSVHRRSLKTILNNRSEGSIEFKHQNISAALIKLGLPYIKGYKPMVNYQQILETSILEYISKSKSKLLPLFLQFSDTIDMKLENIKFSTLIVDPPEKQNILNEPKSRFVRKPFKINYLEREQNNSAIGSLGEKLVIEYEMFRLKSNGQSNLINAIQWISKYDDGAGYDILSKNFDGSDRYIEVKTTKLSREAPFFFSKNEYEFSKSNNNQYYLYRLFNFNSIPKMFWFKGSYETFCNVEAIGYRGSF